MNWKTFGHNNIKQILEKQLAEKKFGHAYLFSGPEQVGKKTLAFEFAEQILKTNNLFACADFLFLDLSNQDSGVEVVREFISQISTKPFGDGFKIAMLDNAQNLNVQSQNALLKTLEEPSEKTIIFLISRAKRLLPTVRSRCLCFNFSNFSMKENELFSENINKAPDKNLLELSFGLPGRLHDLAKNKTFLSEEAEKVEKLKNLIAFKIGERLAQLNSYAEMEAEDLENIFSCGLNYEMSKGVKDLSSFKNIKSFETALRGVSINKNKKLILQELFLTLC